MRKLEPIVKHYYDELENGRIMGRQCPRCGAVMFPPLIACTACGCFDMEWVELSGEGMVTDAILPTAMAHPRIDAYKPCVFGCVTLKEGPEINALVCGISEENEAEIQAALPLPVKARIVQREGYKTLVYDLQRPDGSENAL